MDQEFAEHNWDEFTKWLKSHSSGRIFRGVGNYSKHLLIPSIGRLLDYSLANEINLLEHFKLKSNLLIPKNYNDFEWLVLAQHHGLPTRLLDWTYNPLVAAFFAVRSLGENETARIYAVEPAYSSFADLSKKESPFDIQQIMFLVPPVSTKRIELQRGLFSIHPLPNKPAIILPEGILTEMEYCYDWHQTVFRDYKVNEYNGDPVAYQEEFYSDLGEDFYFDIPHSCRAYFEQMIRALGIDETFNGDLDSIASLLKYQLINKQLPIVTQPALTAAYAGWSKILEREAVEYFKKNPSKLSFIKEELNCLTNVGCYITGCNDYHFNRKSLHGTIGLIVYPNLFSEQRFSRSVSVLSQQSAQSYSSFWHDIGNERSHFYSQGHVYIKMEAQIFFHGSYESISLKELVLKPEKKDLEYLEHLSKTAADLINLCDSLDQDKINIIMNPDREVNAYFELVESVKSRGLVSHNS